MKGKCSGFITGNVKGSLFGIAGALLLIAPVMAEEDKPVFGWVEKSTLEPWGVEVKAKLDSGALTSSMDARDIETFDKDGEEWVRFRLELVDEASGERSKSAWNCRCTVISGYAAPVGATSARWC